MSGHGAQTCSLRPSFLARVVRLDAFYFGRFFFFFFFFFFFLLQGPQVFEKHIVIRLTIRNGAVHA